jgi:peptide/nickel transport system substrate-binding protein
MISQRRYAVRTLCAGAAVVAMTLSGCSSTSSAPPTSTGQPGSTAGASTGAGAGGSTKMGPIINAYRGASGQFIENYNPLSPTVLSDVNGLIYEPLFFFDNLQPLGTAPTPVLAKSYTFDATGKVMTVMLQSGVKWSDGQAFTAKDVAYTFNTMRSNKALDSTGNTPAAKATGDLTVTLTFDKSGFADAPTLLGAPIVPEHIFSKMKDIITDPNKNPVGTGPMKADTFSAQSFSFAKSGTFRAADQVHAPGIRYYSLSGNDAATNKLLAGQLDWSNIFIPNVEQVMKPHPDLHFQNTTTQQVEITTCSNAKLGCTGAQTDPAVRQAMAAAIDRSQVDKLAYFGRGLPISPTFLLSPRDKQFIDPAFPFYPMSPDVAKAKSIMEAAGWKLGSDGIYAKNGQRASMNVIVTAGYTDYIAALDIMKPQMAAAGIEIIPQQQANAEIISARGLGKFQLAMDANFQGPVADPYYIYNTIFTSTGVLPAGQSQNPYGNVSKFSDPAVDAALKAAGSTKDTAVKAAEYKKIQAIVVPALPYIPVLNNQGFAEYSNAHYTGWKLYASGGAEQTLMALTAK